MKKASKRNYTLEGDASRGTFPAPRLPYQPQMPRRYRPRIGLIGCGGVTAHHLAAYREAGWDVVALCDQREDAARRRQQEFYPGAEIYTDYRRLLQREDVDVVDVALHPGPRAVVIEAALKAGKHVLSQKPFVLDLSTGRRLVALAARLGWKLAVNQNGRWAPYVSYIHQAIRAGLIGKVQTVTITLNWDHTWIQGTPFEKIRQVVLYDFAIHWFDMATLFFEGRKPLRVFASSTTAAGQKVKPPMIGSAIVLFKGGAARLGFDGHSRFGVEESLCLTGSQGTIRARGPICDAHDLTLFTRRGAAKPALEGKWFNDGFRGAMGELLCAIEEEREPSNSGRRNLDSLAVCFAAVKAADSGRPQTPGDARRLSS